MMAVRAFDAGKALRGDHRIRGIFGRHVKLPVDKNRIAAERDRHSAPRTRESDDREASTERSPAVSFSCIF